MGGVASGRARQERERDRQIVEAYLLQDGRRGAIAAIAQKLGLSRRTVERALQRHRLGAEEVAPTPSREARRSLRTAPARPATKPGGSPRALRQQASAEPMGIPDLFTASGVTAPPARRPRLPSSRRDTEQGS
jgi:hypothetical protein